MIEIRGWLKVGSFFNKTMWFFVLKRNGHFITYKDETCKKIIKEYVIGPNHRTYKSGKNMITIFLQDHYSTFYDPTKNDLNIVNAEARAYTCKTD